MVREFLLLHSFIQKDNAMQIRHMRFSCHSLPKGWNYELNCVGFTILFFKNAISSDLQFFKCNLRTNLRELALSFKTF